MIKTTSLELSKRIAELEGGKGESEYMWRGLSNNTALDPKKWFYSWSVVHNLESVPGRSNNARLRYVPAYTTDELAEKLPSNINHHYPEDEVRGAWLSCDKSDDGDWCVGYGEDRMNHFELFADSLCEALGLMYAHLLTRGIIIKE